MRTVVLALVLLAVVGCEEPESSSETAAPAADTLVRMPQTTPDNTPDSADAATDAALPTSDAGQAQEPAQADAGAQRDGSAPSITPTPVSTPAPVATPSPVSTPAPVKTPVPEVITVKAFYDQRVIILDGNGNDPSGHFQEEYLRVTIFVGAGEQGTDRLEIYDNIAKVQLKSGSGRIQGWPLWSGDAGEGSFTTAPGTMRRINFTFDETKKTIQTVTLYSAKAGPGFDVRARFEDGR